MDGLSELVGPAAAEAAWSAAVRCTETSLAASEIEVLTEIATALAAQPTVAGVFARSLLIRLRSFALIAKMDVAPAPSEVPTEALHRDPLTDPARLQEIADLGLHSIEADEILQETARAAAAYFKLPNSMVSIVMNDSQFFAAMHGVDGWIADAAGTPAEWSFCQNPVRSQSEFIVEDAREHPLMKDSPLVTLEGARCYAGVPLTTSRGYTVGAFCVAGNEARTFIPEEIDVLHGYARRVMEQLEARRQVSSTSMVPLPG